MVTYNFSKARKYVPFFYGSRCSICDKSFREGETMYVYLTGITDPEGYACKNCKMVLNAEKKEKVDKDV